MSDDFKMPSALKPVDSFTTDSTSLPPGWRAVPEEPTEGIGKASALHHDCACGRRITQWGVNAWSAMLAAAPPPPPQQDELVRALEELVNAKALEGVRELVAGWNGENRPTPYTERHPSNLGASLPETTAGAVYALDEALTSASAALAKFKEQSHGE